MHRAIVALALMIGAAETYSLPQNPEQEAKQSRDTLAWHRESLGDAYQKVGNKSPKWDQATSHALDLVARHLAGDGDPPPPETDLQSALQIALNAGCDDPLVRYLQVRYKPQTEFRSRPDRLRAYKDAVAAMEKSAYQASRRSAAHLALAIILTEEKEFPEPERADVEHALANVLELMPTVVAEGNGRDAQHRWFELSCRVVACQSKLNGGDDAAAIAKVDAELAKVPELKATRHLVQGTFLIHKGWADYRAARKELKNREEEWNTCCERLVQGRELLNAALEAQPGSEVVATWMLWVELGVGRERPNMEKWFDIAMKANGNNREACEVKLAWLDPRWHGSSESLLEFGKQCRETKNWRAGITVLAAEAHLYQSQYLESDGKSPTEYLKQPEVWDEIRAVYEEYLSHFPDNSEQRTRFAVFCSLCEQYGEAHRQFARLGDKIVVQHDFDLDQIRKFKEVATEKATEEGVSP